MNGSDKSINHCLKSLRSRSYAIYLFFIFCSNSGETVAVTTQFFFSSGSLQTSPQHYNTIFLILVFVFHFKNIFILLFFVSYLKEKTRNVFLNVACTPCTK